MSGNTKKMSLVKTESNKTLITHSLFKLKEKIRYIKEVTIWESPSIESTDMIEYFKSLDEFYKGKRKQLFENYSNRKNLRIISKAGMEYLDEFNEKMK